MTHLTFKNNDRLPALGLGTWKSKPGEIGTAIREAIHIGYRHFDCSPIYGNEAEIGTAFSEAFAAGDVKREELWVTSKLWNDHHRLHEVRPALEKTLSDLQLGYLDLYLIHWPVVLKKGAPFPFSADAFLSLEEVPIEETWRGMEACLEAGLCRHIGVSNFSLEKTKALLAHAKHAPEMNQVESHPLLPQKELFDFCQKNGVHFTAYSPLGSRDLPGGKKEKPDLFDLKPIREIAEAHGCPPAQILLAWAVRRGTAVIPKSVNPVRLRQNLEAAKLELSEKEMGKIAAIESRFRFIDGSFWTPEGSPYTLGNLWE